MIPIKFYLVPKYDNTWGHLAQSKTEFDQCTTFRCCPVYNDESGQDKGHFLALYMNFWPDAQVTGKHPHSYCNAKVIAIFG